MLLFQVTGKKKTGHGKIKVICLIVFNESKLVKKY